MPTVPCPLRLEPVTLENDFVRLEPLSRAHLPALTEVALSEARIWQWMRFPVRTPDDAVRWLDDALARQASGLQLPFTVLDRATGAVVGSTRYLDYRPDDRGIEIGWTWYAPRVWGTRVNPACKLLLMEHAFELLGCVRVQYVTDERNTRSRAAIARLGARQEGILRKHAVVAGGWLRTTVVFSILDDEWPAVRDGLRARLT
jgi:RimJ/RimL family protein N-acetyltransferase